ncbi:hypothetical protein [Anaeromyxobacter oryzae]|uniref:Roadblock/LAMTOR2 domain-containing protein n=1 Tax=Anaeromyxobacter oryzae TaxID=2918170 RepID=A0ABM7WYN9_9BACT|nr:hypothetical protein [Anaeromyxobacter oryzae]BDG04657.1 hypothetical protein AMOR_36530 [Anaeromyxobacter oryzae]
MSELALIAGLPEVRSAVLGDVGGTFLDALREEDGETVAAVAGFVVTSLLEAGEHLGLGALQRITFAGANRAHVLAVRGGSVLTAAVEPAAAHAGVEKALETSLQGRG